MDLKEKFNGGGLLETPKEKMKFSFGAVFGYPDPATLPDEFDVGEPIEIKNQNIPSSSFICVAESLVSVSEYQEKITLEPAYVLKLITEISNTIQWIYQGTSLEIGAKAALRGFLERQESPYSVEKDGVEVSATPKNWNASYDKIAEKHKKQAWFWIGVSGKLNMFDAIRGAMYQFKDEKRAIQAGVIWNGEWTDKTYIDALGTPAYGHAVCVKGWKGDYLIIQNSLGKEIGENGLQYFHKNIVNSEFGKFKALMFADMPISEEEILKKSRSYRIGLMGVIIDFIKRVLGLMKEEIKTIPPVPVIPPIVLPVVPPPTPPAITPLATLAGWETPAKAIHSARVIMDEYNLNWEEKALLCAVIMCESSFEWWRTHKNNNGTTDWGICMFNDGKNKDGIPYWIGKGATFENTDEVLNNPKKCVKIMIKEYKKWKYPKWWVCYLGDYHKKFLAQFLEKP